MKPSEYIGRAIDLFYIAPLRRWIPHEMFRYGACGAFNMALDLVLYYLIYHFVIAERFCRPGDRYRLAAHSFAVHRLPNYLLQRLLAQPQCRVPALGGAARTPVVALCTVGRGGNPAQLRLDEGGWSNGSACGPRRQRPLLPSSRFVTAIWLHAITRSGLRSSNNLTNRPSA